MHVDSQLDRPNGFRILTCRRVNDRLHDFWSAANTPLSHATTYLKSLLPSLFKSKRSSRLGNDSFLAVISYQWNQRETLGRKNGLYLFPGPESAVHNFPEGRKSAPYDRSCNYRH